MRAAPSPRAGSSRPTCSSRCWSWRWRSKSPRAGRCSISIRHFDIFAMKKVLIDPLIGAALAGAWFFFKSHAAAAEESAKPAAKVETTALADQPIAQTIEVFGVVSAAPSGEQVISTPYDIVVRKVHVSVGTTVAAGDVLLEVDPSPDAKLAADSARSVLALATRALAAVQERYDLKLANSQELLTAQQAADEAKLKADSFTARGLGGDGRIVAAAAGRGGKRAPFAGVLAPAGRR